MSTKKRRSNVVTKALLITALASGIAGMQAQPAFANNISAFGYGMPGGIISNNYDRPDVAQIIDLSTIDYTKEFYIRTSAGGFTYDSEDDNDTIGYYGCLYYSPVDKSISQDQGPKANFKAGQLYYITRTINANHDDDLNIIKLGDAKSILGGSSSSGELSEEQKTMIKDLIANWPRLCRLVENFFERNDDNNEYEKKT